MAQRHEMESKLKGETLVRKGLLRKHDAIPVLRLIPDLHVVKIGGHGLVDYGRDVVLPLMEEIGELSKQHKILVVTGVGGTGIVTIGGILGMAAHLEGKGASVLDMAGLAQKNGAVWSHLRIG